MHDVIADTGALVALLSRTDHQHDWALSSYRTLRPPMLTCEAVLVEAYHLLGRNSSSREHLADLFFHGALKVDFQFTEQASLIWTLLEKYADTPMDFADACLVRMSELHPERLVWTVDSDFQIYRCHQSEAIPTLAPWN